MTLKILRSHYRLLVTTFILCFYVIPTYSAVKLDPLVKCLAREEAHLHKIKDIGPDYSLNQEFINDVSAFGGAPFKAKYLKQICAPNAKTSFELLKVLVLHGKSVFRSFSGQENVYVKASLQTLLESIPLTFFNYISKIHALFPSANCLNTDVPEIPYFLNRFKYLQTDLTNKQLLSDRKKIVSILNKLSNIGPLITKCHKRLKKSQR
jgi:hypothetical protein